MILTLLHFVWVFVLVLFLWQTFWQTSLVWFFCILDLCIVSNLQKDFDLYWDYIPWIHQQKDLVVFFLQNLLIRVSSFKVRFQVQHVAILISLSHHQPPKYCATKVIVFLKKNLKNVIKKRLLEIFYFHLVFLRELRASNLSNLQKFAGRVVDIHLISISLHLFFVHLNWVDAAMSEMEKIRVRLTCRIALLNRMPMPN